MRSVSLRLRIGYRIKFDRRIGQTARQEHPYYRSLGKPLPQKLLSNFEVLTTIQDIVKNHNLMPHAGASDCFINARDRK